MKKSRYSSISEINVTSLVDVTMVLLIIFMLTAPFIQAGIKVKLPRTRSTIIKEREGIVIAVTSEGSVYLNKKKMELDELGDTIRRLKVAGEDRVFVRADKEVAYGKVMEVIGKVKDAGIDEVGMITEIKK